MPAIEITPHQARRFLLAHHGLWPPQELAGKMGVLDYIRRVGCIQYDPLNIVGHNPDLVLQARVSGYQPRLLQELLYQDRKLLDGWDKVMSIYPVEDWPCFRRFREAQRNGAEQEVRSVLPQVRAALEARGPLSSLDLDFGRTIDWAWAPARLARAALESMHFWGELVIHHRVHTRKVYDLTYRHLPQELLAASDPNQTEEQYHDWRVERRIGGAGLIWNRSGDAWLGMGKIKSRERLAALARLLDQGRVQEVRVEGVEVPLYLRSQDRPRLEAILGASDPPAQAAVLAPLDNLLWDRRLVKALFDFDYRWEVYKPAAQRSYGYYVLPVLYGDRFIARFEPARENTAPRPNRGLIIKNWWWEPGVNPSEEIRSGLKDCFRSFLGYLGAGVLQVDPQAANGTCLDWLDGPAD